MLVQLVSLFAFAASSLAVPVADITSLGYLRCSSEGQVTGYLSKSLNSAGVYKGVSPDSDPNDVNHRMLVSLDVTATGTEPPRQGINLLQHNNDFAPETYPTLAVERAGQRLPVLGRHRWRRG
jgi:hypothetical protein